MSVVKDDKSATKDFLRKAIPIEHTEELKKVVADLNKEEKTGFWSWLKKTYRKVPIQFIRVMLKVLREFFKKEVRTLLLDLFKRAVELQHFIDAGTMTPEESARKLRKDAKEIAPDVLKNASFIINFLIELAVFAVKVIKT